MQVKQLDHINLSVADIDASVAFYRSNFGFEVVEEGRSYGVRYSIIRSGDRGDHGDPGRTASPAHHPCGSALPVRTSRHPDREPALRGPPERPVRLIVRCPTVRARRLGSW